MKLKKKGALAILLSIIMFFSGCTTNSNSTITEKNDDTFTTTSNDTYDCYTNDEGYKYRVYKFNNFESKSSKNFKNTETKNEFSEEDLINIYDEATTEVSELIKTLGFENSIECLYFFEYLLSTSSLSLDKVIWTNNQSEFLDIEQNLGIDVLYGTVACRHITDFYTDVLNKCNYEAYAVPCYQTDIDNEKEKTPNHSIVIVNEKNTIGTTYHDPTSKLLMDKDVRTNLVFSDSNSSYVYLMPEFSDVTKNVICTHYNENEISKINELFNNDNGRVSSSYIIYQYEITNLIIKENESVIEEFEKDYENNILSFLPKKSSFMR